MSEEIRKENPLGGDLPDPLSGAAEEAAAETVAAVGESVGAAEETVEAAADATEETAAEEAVCEAADAAEDTAEQADEALNEELETLRDTFQEKYDETVEEAARGPVIQELETHSGDAEEEPEETEDAVAEAAKPAKKKMKKGVKALLAVLIVVAVLFFGLLIAYFVASVTNPNFNSMVSSLAGAYSAEDYDAKKAAYEETLSYCDGDSALQVAMKEYVVDEILKAAYEEKGQARRRPQGIMDIYGQGRQRSMARFWPVKNEGFYRWIV